jgi:hypothetical protein
MEKGRESHRQISTSESGAWVLMAVPSFKMSKLQTSAAKEPSSLASSIKADGRC